ncbi:MAG: hypothetical protein NWR67_10705 [Saprospiraceae bacterium]|jgi:hypothetical protein|nr:hypothetical protein [Saprospiraceae bacterium]MDP4821469.1 hypothetical protein [Saprospiraceae bacterium]MDP4998054.1 hypothetical protein [Saprospiraceae bacterium]
MKTLLRISFLVFFLSSTGNPALAVESGKIKPTDAKETAAPSKKETRREKRIARWQDKWESAGANLRSLTDDNNFMLGLLLLGGAIVLAILSGLGILRGLLGLISGLAALAGLALVIIALWHYYS